LQTGEARHGDPDGDLHAAAEAELARMSMTSGCQD